MAVLAFDRARRTAAGLSVDAVCCRVRIAARVAGCRRVEILAVDSEARELLASGDAAHDVIVRCRSLAQALVRQRTAQVPA